MDEGGHRSEKIAHIPGDDPRIDQMLINCVESFEIFDSGDFTEQIRDVRNVPNCLAIAPMQTDSHHQDALLIGRWIGVSCICPFDA